jgi:hypothetical protein
MFENKWKLQNLSSMAGLESKTFCFNNDKLITCSSEMATEDSLYSIFQLRHYLLHMSTLPVLTFHFGRIKKL